MTTYYVSKTGSNLNNGSEGQPFLTITHAATIVKPGDTVIVLPGVYDEHINTTIDGTADAWITFRAHPNHMARDIMEQHGFDNREQYGVVVRGGDCGFDIRSSYIWIEGFFVTSTHASKNEKESCDVPIRARNSNHPDFGGKPKGQPHHHIEIRNNVVYNGSESGITCQSVDYLFVRNNIVYQNSSNGAWEGSGISIGHTAEGDDCNSVPDGDTQAWRFIVEGNICYGNSNYDVGRRKRKEFPLDLPRLQWTTGFHANGSTDGNGIIIDFARFAYTSRTLVRNNITYNNGARGICVTASYNVAVVNNTMYDNAWDPNQAFHLNQYDDWGPFNAPCHGTICANNIIYSKNPPRNVIGMRPKHAKSYQGYNLYFNGSIDADCMHEGDIIEKDPLFVNAPPLIGTKGRPEITMMEPTDAGYSIHPLTTEHYTKVDFSLQKDSPAIGSGYHKNSAFTKPHPDMTDETLAELKFFLEKALPTEDAFGRPRNPEKMDMGAVVFG